MSKYTWMAILLGLLPGQLVIAQEGPISGSITRVGTTAAQFLKLGAGARAVSLGGAYVAEANDMSAVYWNPAGFARLTGNQLQLSNTQYLADINYNFVAYGTSVDRFGSIGLSLLMVESGEMDVRTEIQPEGTGERFNVLSFALQLTYARNLSRQFSIGGSVKLVQERIWHSQASSIAFDIGTLFTTPLPSLRLGASMSNLGPKMRMDGRDVLFSEDPAPNADGTAEIVNAQYRMDGFSMPLLFRVGLAWDALDTGTHHILMTVDAAHPNDNSEYVNTGAEYVFRDLIAFRIGYRNLFEPDTEQGITAGGGLMIRIHRDLAARIDYAYADFGRLTQTHWFTFNLAF